MQPAFPPLPVVVIGGFLGAGKTTLLNHLLTQCGTTRVAVLVNDFGAIGIDAELIVNVDGGVINLANGCICCDVRDDLLVGCLAVLNRPDRPDLLVVETSGVSNALQVANTFLSPALGGMLSIQAIVGIVDAAHFADLQGESAALAQAQLAAADIVVINKVDLATDRSVASIREMARKAAPAARLIETTHGRVSAEVLLDPVSGPDRRVSDAVGASHTGFSAWHWTCARPLSLDRLRRAFERLPDGVYRAKGIVHLGDLPSHRVLLQQVGQRSALMVLGPWRDEPPVTRIVMIAETASFDVADATRLLESSAAIGDAQNSPLMRLAAQIGLRASDCSLARARSWGTP